MRKIITLQRQQCKSDSRHASKYRLHVWGLAVAPTCKSAGFGQDYWKESHVVLLQFVKSKIEKVFPREKKKTKTLDISRPFVIPFILLYFFLLKVDILI